MELSEWFSIIQFLAIIVVGVILYQKIKAQSELMDKYKQYIDILDINKIEQAVKFRDEATLSKIQSWAETDGRKFIISELDKKYGELDTDFQTNYDEMANVLYAILRESEPDERELLLGLLPNSGSMFLDELQKEEKNNPFSRRRNQP
jgi:hypothetical protein